MVIGAMTENKKPHQSQMADLDAVWF